MNQFPQGVPVTMGVRQGMQQPQMSSQVSVAQAQIETGATLNASTI